MKDPSSNTTSVSYEDCKKTDEPMTQAPSGNIFWRFGSGLVSTTTGAVGAGVGLGVGAIKLVANTSYGVVSKTAEIGVSASKKVAATGYNAVSGVASKIPTPSFQKGKDKED